LPNPRGRYKTDYEELDMIGEGGFGRVYRCKHRIDSNTYAVKKMVINYNDTKSFKLLK
jgi:serine/threonine protein kinase